MTREIITNFRKEMCKDIRWKREWEQIVRKKLEETDVEYERFNSSSHVCLVYAAGQNKLEIDELGTIWNTVVNMLNFPSGTSQ